MLLPNRSYRKHQPCSFPARTAWHRLCPSRLLLVRRRRRLVRNCGRRSVAVVVSAEIKLTRVEMSHHQDNQLPSCYERLAARLGPAGQLHVLQDWAALSPEEQAQLSAEVEAFDFDFVARLFKTSLAGEAAQQQQQEEGGRSPSGGPPGLEPCNDVLTLDGADAQQRAAWRAAGLTMLAAGQVAVLLLAGGQGTRLGSDAPKGCYDIGLPSRKSLFQLQAERLLRLQRLAAAHASAHSSMTTQGKTPPPALRWVIMTSRFTHDATLAHFEAHGFFGLQREQVTFFQQGALPCLTENGRVIMASRSSIAQAPDGNGGVYLSLKASGVLDMLQAQGVLALDCYCVDNALARLGDPLFLGYCAAQRAQVGARVVAKASPQEKVGVFARRGGPGGPTCVIEYSELPADQAHAADPATGRLLYNWSNICMHYFSVEWLQQVCEQLQGGGVGYHVARKRIPSRDGPVQGIKLELFIFDTFPAAQRVALMEVERAAEFAPVKVVGNAPGSSADSPDTARAAVLALGARWVQEAGGRVASGPSAQEGVEVSPLVSYAGEGLETFVGGLGLGTGAR